MHTFLKKISPYLKAPPHTIALSFLWILFIALSNYRLAKLAQGLILSNTTSFSYIWSLSIPWLLIGILPFCVVGFNAFHLHQKELHKNFKEIGAYAFILAIGLAAFIALGITQYFHSVKYPFIFILVTPLVEELIFRGWMFDWSSRLVKISPTLLTAILFGLHHWQYFGYRITPFALFQMAYTFLLGLVFGKMREKSGAVYLTIVFHMLINFVSYTF